MINEKGLDLIKSFEGLRLKAYTDQGGKWTIGYGDTENVCEGDCITLEEAEARLLVKLEVLEKQISKLVKVPLNPNRLAALVSFSYNEGIGSLKRSTLLNSINKNQWLAAADSFLLWNKVGGHPDRGLERRRQAERDLFLESMYG